MGIVGELSYLGRQLGEAVRDGLLASLPQDTESGIRCSLQNVFTVAREKVVLTITQEGEVVVFDPLEERPGFVELLRVDRRCSLVESGDDVLNPVAHLRPVLDGRAHVPKNPVEVFVEIIQYLRLCLAVDLHVYERLGDRVFVYDVMGQTL